MDAKELKLHLLEDTSRIEDVLEYYGFSMFWRSGDEIRCAPPESENRTACSIKLTEDLYASMYTMESYHGDIYGLIERTSGDSFSSIIRMFKSLLGISSSGKPFRKKVDLFSNVNKYLREEGRKDVENTKHDKAVLNKFIHLPHKSFIEEGIAPGVLEAFSVCYDPERDRIVIPHYDWEETDKIVGLSGRTTLSAEESKALDIPKYWHYIKGFSKTHNLFGWNHARKYVNEEKKLLIFESEKSVMKQVTRDMGRRCFSVSVGGHTISEKQSEFIIMNTEPDTEIIIAFDRDVMDMKDRDGNLIGEEYLLDICEKFHPYRKVSYIWDNFDLLNETDSPIDKSLTIWRVLLKFRKSLGGN